MSSSSSNSMHESKNRKIPRFFFTLSLNIKMYHWTTQSFAEHKATDELYIALEPLIYEFVEVWSRDIERPTADFEVSVYNMDRNEFINKLNQTVEWLRSIENNLNVKNTELLNIRDSMIASLNKTLYQFTLQ